MPDGPPLSSDDARNTASRLAREIRRLRKARGWSQPQLATAISYTRQYVSLAERAGQNLPSRPLVAALDKALEASGLLLQLREQAEGEQRSNRRLVQAAPQGSSHADTPAAARRAPLRSRCCASADTSNSDRDSDSALAAHVADDGKVSYVPLSRRTLLRNVGALSIGSVVGASVAIDVKPSAYYRAVLRTLIDNDNVFGPAEVAPRAEAQIVELAHMSETVKGTDRTELIALRSQFAELCAWLYQDLSNFAVAQYWADRALDWSYLAKDPELTTIVLARKSQLACDQNDSETAVGIGSYALSTASNQKLAAAANTYAAHGYALGGNRTAAEKLYEKARELVSTAGRESRWGGWLDHSYIDVHRAQSLTELGDFRDAADAFDLAISQLPDRYHRDKGVYLARSARAHAGAGDADYAAEVGVRSVAIALDTRSGRTVSELTRLATDLREMNSAPVLEFRDALHSLA